MSTGPFLRRILPTLFTLLCFLSLAISDDLQTLLTIKTSLKNSNTFVFDSWDAKNPACNFTGITCDPTTNLVKEIELSNQNLSVNEDLNNCVNLRYLDLANNNFLGSIPDISFLNKLMYFYVNSSGFSGTFPWNSLDNMTNLVEFSIGDNLFDRTPFPIGVVKNIKLNVLHMSNCSTEGRIPPGIGNLTELRNLELSRNYISGKIPVEITKLTNLWQLKLSRNQLTGKLPVGFGNLTNLQRFGASINYLTGDISEIRHLTKLLSLHLNENELTGELPAELGEFKQLEYFSIYGNKLTGIIPRNLGSWSDFKFIDASENFFTGSIPPEMCKKGTIRAFLLLQNNLTGEIPESYANCVALIRLRVSENLLTGVVPKGIWGLPNIDMIDIAMNKLVGPITSDIKNAKSLTKLLTKDNQFSSQLPSEISMAANSGAIDLSGNLFSGGIPSTIGELKQLNHLYLQINKFSGPIPDSLGSCHSLSHINLAYNSLTELKEFSSMFIAFEGFTSIAANLLFGAEEEILDGINRDNLIGNGGSGNVYKISLENGTDLAAKHIWNSYSVDRKIVGSSTTPMLSKGRAKSSEFDAEVRILSSIRHVNVVKLYCSITSEDSSLLVYEYMPNGSLWDQLHSNKKLTLDWETRYEIALANAGKDSSHLIAGTHGYIAPEYGYTQKVNEMSDVYSFGVVLMELITGKKPIEPEFGENMDMVSWVSSKLKNKETVFSTVDSAILEGYKEEALKVLKIAILCTARQPMQRPTMRTVVQMSEADCW
ncbi:hypothetical protein ACH5RR_034851 [Cinchona calisaya]|uniref:Protein kinase domain-containing protein n=1 Tax=Cinchona calisaya TaxID=153742 RepID=A0ABD2YCM1_9GENT